MKLFKKTCVFKFSFKELEKLTKQSNNIAQVYISALKENVQTLVFRVEMLAAMTPEERYEALLKRNPALFQKAFNKHIANYPGMTPNSLSRIIKRRKTPE